MSSFTSAEPLSSPVFNSESPDYYGILGINQKADDDNIKDAYYRMALRYHPDKNPGAAGLEKMKEINEARQVLTNPSWRVAYNEAKGISNVAPAPPPSDGPTVNFQTGHSYTVSQTKDGKHDGKVVTFVRSELNKENVMKAVVATKDGELLMMGTDKLETEGTNITDNLRKIAESIGADLGDEDRLDKELKKKTKAKLCFLLDCTGSMTTAIVGVKDKITEIIENSGKMFRNVDIAVGMVGYRDYGDATPFEFCPFGPKEQLISRLARTETTGGGDFPEDVLGGMDCAVNNMDWSDCEVKLLIHIGDAPHHGIGNYDHPHMMGDNFVNKEHSPRTSSDILRDYASKKIDYYFLAVPFFGVVYTGKMSNRFQQEYNAVKAGRKHFTICHVDSFTTNELFRLIVSSLNTTLVRQMSVMKLGKMASMSRKS